MKKLDTKTILIENNFSSKIFNGMLFTFAGILASFLPIIYFRTLNKNTLIGFVVCTLCFGIPFGFFFGIRRLIPTIVQKKAISAGNYVIYIDVVKSTRMLSQGVKSEKGDYYCQIEFEKYSKQTGEYYTISRRMFDKTKDGDEFYLVSLGDIKKTISIFPRKSYVISKEILEKVAK